MQLFFGNERKKKDLDHEKRYTQKNQFQTLSQKNQFLEIIPNLWLHSCLLHEIQK